MAEFGRRELELMQILWTHGPQTAREIREKVKDPVADPTVRTILRILEGKKAVAHTKRGRAFIYKARVAAKTTLKKMMQRIIKGFFDGKAEGLVEYMLEDKLLKPASLAKIGKK